MKGQNQFTKKETVTELEIFNCAKEGYHLQLSGNMSTDILCTLFPNIIKP